MASDLASRLLAVMAGKPQNMPVTTGAPVTGCFGYRSKSLKLPWLPVLPVYNDDLPKAVIRPVAGPVTRPVDAGNADSEGVGVKPTLQDDYKISLDERAAIAVELGKVPPVYADAFARLQCQRLSGIPHDWQARAADMAGQLLDRHGAALVTLGWPVAAIFDSPLVLATAGESAALDLRRAGLVWQMREGDTIERLAHDSALIRYGDGREWTFHRGTQ